MNDMEKIKAQIDEWRTTYEVYEISYRHFTKCGESTTPLENDLILQNTCVFRKEETSLQKVIEILDFFYASVLKRKGVIRENTTADVAPVRHGRYIIDDMGDSSCSECGEKWLDVTQNYCPHCGALLDAKK